MWHKLTLAACLCMLAALALSPTAASRAKTRAHGAARAQDGANNAPASLNLKDFGAIGDGVSNDGPALQAALDALATAGGGTLFVPEGRYAILTKVSKDFTGLNASVTIFGVASNTPVAPPTATGNEQARGLDLKSEFRPRTGNDAMLVLAGLRGATIKDIAFMGTPGVEVDAAYTLALFDIDDASVEHCEFYGLSSNGKGSDVVVTRSHFKILRSVFLGCTANSGVHTSVVQNIEWKSFRMEEAIFLDYGLRPELFSKTGVAAPFSWVELGNAAALTPDSPRREAVFRSVFMDEGGLFGISSFPAAYPVPPSAPVDLVYVSNLRMNVSNLNSSGNYITGVRGVLIENSAYGWSKHADAAIRLEGPVHAILDRIETAEQATRFRADAFTARLTVIDSEYTDLASLAQQTVIINTTQPDQDPVQYVRGRFQTALGRAPDGAAHFYWSDKILRCGADSACVTSARAALDAYLATTPAETFEITGKVTDEGNAPVAGVTIALTGSQTATATTDAAGLYRFAKLPTSGVYTVTASTPSHDITTPPKNVTTPAGNVTANFSAKLKRFAINGRVADDAGAAISGVTLTLTGSQSATATSDAGGNYSFANLAGGGNYTVTPSKTGTAFTPQAQTFTNLSADSRADFKGAPAIRAISGFVVNAGNAGIQGVTVSLTGSTTATTTTAANGSYSFTSLPLGGSFVVTPTLLGYTFAPASTSFTNLTADGRADFVGTFVEYKITGRVAKSDNTAVSGVSVALTGSKSATATTDANGNYSFNAPSGGNYTVTPSKTDYSFSPTSRSINALSSDQTASFTATPGSHKISGRVSEGTPGVSGVTISLAGSQTGTTTTDANGNYSFNVITGGNYTVTPALSHYGFTPQSQSFTNVVGDKTANFNATRLRHNISGRVTKPDGSALAGATVALTGSQTATATTDAQGNYSFKSLAGGGNYAVTPSKAHYTFAPAPKQFSDLGADQTADFVGTLGTHTISGRVEKPNGAGVAGVTVALTGSKSATATTDSNGGYSFANLDGGGNYTVTASSATYNITPPSRAFTDLSSNQTADFVASLADYRIGGRVTQNGSGVAGVSVALTGSRIDSATTGPDGSYSFTVPAEGNYTVTPSKAHHTFAPASRAFTNLDGNKTADFAATLLRFAIHGRVTDINGASLQGIKVSLSGSQAATTTTASDGSYSFPSLAADGTYTVTPSFANFSFSPESKTFAGLDADTYAGFAGGLARFRIGGRVTEAGAGVGGVLVELAGSHPLLGPESQSVLTAADGTYSFGVTSGGTYVIKPSKLNYTFAPDSKSFASIDGDRSADFAATRVRFVEFGAATLSVGEGGGSLEVTVTRGGDSSEEVSAVYEIHSGTALRGSDVVGAAGRVTFEPGETAKTFTIFITDDALVEGSEGFSVGLTPEGDVALGERPAVAVTINDNDTNPSAPNPLEDTDFFVREQYRDFLGRDPDAPGLAFWKNEIEKCGQNAQCREEARINVSGAFFLAIEFQQSGFFAYKAYEAAYGRTPERLMEFTLDAHDISAGVIVGQPGWELKLEARKGAYISDFVARPLFVQHYPLSMTPAQFVATLNSNTGDSLTAAEVQAAVSEFAGEANTEDLAARARVLRRIVDNGAFHKRETSPAFVLMQYFGYLRRAPDDPPNTNLDGYNFWLKKLNDNGGDFKRAEMVKAFLVSDEYRHRFGN